MGCGAVPHPTHWTQRAGRESVSRPRGATSIRGAGVGRWGLPPPPLLLPGPALRGAPPCWWLTRPRGRGPAGAAGGPSLRPSPRRGRRVTGTPWVASAVSFPRTAPGVPGGDIKPRAAPALQVRARYPACTAPHANEATPLISMRPFPGQRGARGAVGRCRLLGTASEWAPVGPAPTCDRLWGIAALLKPTKPTRSDTNPSTPGSASTRAPCTSGLPYGAEVTQRWDGPHTCVDPTGGPGMGACRAALL